MDQPAPFPSAQDMAAALDWWREAGVDQCFGDEAAALLGAEVEQPGEQATTAAPPPTRMSEMPEQASPTIGGDAAEWPTDLAAFQKWWLDSPLLGEAAAYPRIAPRGSAGATLMVLVPMPEAQDNQTLLSGTEGAFLHAILAAMEIPSDEAYFASLLPHHMPHADLGAAGAAGFAAILDHHLSLAKPQRLVAFGRDLAAMLSTDGPPALTSYSLSALRQRPAFRAGFWRQWLDFSGDIAS